MSQLGLMPLFLQEFDNVFVEPIRLSPPRRHNHIIHLLPNITLIIIRSYRYPQLVKDELEQ
jgi:hypothetical protein